MADIDTYIVITNKSVPVSGATVVVGDTGKGDTTDADGRIKIQLDNTDAGVHTVAINGAYFTTIYMIGGGTYEIKIDS